MGVRCLGAITRDRLEALRETDAIVREEIDKAGPSIWQYFAVVPDFRTTGHIGKKVCLLPSRWRRGTG